MSAEPELFPVHVGRPVAAAAGPHRTALLEDDA
jgi:hypothetical protein